MIDSDTKTLLDLGSGCGVVGFELLFHCPRIFSLDSVEIQREAYESSYQKNKASLLYHLSKAQVSPDIKIHWMNYKDFFSAKKFDIIVANPPYFQVGIGKQSPSEFKNRCRFHKDASFKDFVDSVTRNLNNSGSAFIILRDGADNGISYLNQIKTQIDNRYTINKLEPIRTSEFIQIVKNK